MAIQIQKKPETSKIIEREVITDKFSPFVIVAFIVIAFGLGWIISKKEIAISGFCEKRYEEGRSIGQKETEAKYDAYYNDPAIIKRMTAEILSVSSDAIKVKGNLINLDNPIKANEDREYNILVNDQTKIIKQIRKTEEEYDNEMKEYEQEISKNSLAAEEIIPPRLFKEIEANKIDLVAGAKVLIETNDNLKGTNQATAKIIILEI